ncbi:hypothetical protein FOA52_002427 [Chlamydomonas sp. UWO 241]|nr:hypothetical protein FOA52_002427 [Chlamydomonas sp. UWO 241]
MPLRCSPECEAVGTCREVPPAASGQQAMAATCDCPFGYTGAACKTLLLPACRLTTEPRAFMSCEQAEDTPRACECHRQCVALMCGGRDDPQQAECTRAYPRHVPCFERPLVPTDAQLSNVPDENEPGVAYWSTFRLDAFDDTKVPPRHATKRSSVLTTALGRASTTLPHAACPNACSGRGTCVAVSGRAAAGASVARCSWRGMRVAVAGREWRALQVLRWL